MNKPTQPQPEQIKACIAQIVQHQPITYDSRTHTYAQLCLADFQSCLAEWCIDQTPLSKQMAALPQVAEALKQTKLPAEDAKKLIAFIQHHAKQGQQTAQLYWAYLQITGKYLTQNPTAAIHILRQLQQKNDWRATRFMGEILIQVPQIAPDIFLHNMQETARAWQAQHPHLNLAQVLQHCQAFTQTPQIIKSLAKTQFELATQQGSPIANQRLRSLITAGKLPSNPTIKAHQSLENWLHYQYQRQQYNTTSNLSTQIEDDPDIMVLPENIPLLLSDHDNENPVWQKVVIIGGVLLCFVLILTILMQKMV